MWKSKERHLLGWAGLTGALLALMSTGCGGGFIEEGDLSEQEESIHQTPWYWEPDNYDHCVLYSDRNLQGAPLTLSGYVNRVSKFNSSQNDTHSSIWVRNGWRARIYTDFNYSGSPAVLCGDVNSGCPDPWGFPAPWGNGTYWNLDDLAGNNLDDKISSIVCDKIGTTAPIGCISFENPNMYGSKWEVSGLTVQQGGGIPFFHLTSSVWVKDGYTAYLKNMTDPSWLVLNTNTRNWYRSSRRPGGVYFNLRDFTGMDGHVKEMQCMPDFNW